MFDYLAKVENRDDEVLMYYLGLVHIRENYKTRKLMKNELTTLSRKKFEKSLLKIEFIKGMRSMGRYEDFHKQQRNSSGSTLC